MGISHRMVLGTVLVLTSTACESSEPTQLLVTLSTDLEVPDALDAAKVEVFGPEGALAHEEIVPLVDAQEHGSWRFLASFGAVPRNGEVDRQVTVRVGAIRREEVLFTTRAVTGFVPNRRMRLDIFLAAACLDLATSCRPEETCGLEGCVDPVVPADALVPVDTVMDGPSDPRRPPPTPPDAGVPDAGLPDAGPLNGGGERCNAGDDDGDGEVDEGTVCGALRPASHGDSIYLMGGDPVGWTEAREACRARGYDLLVIESEEEDRWVWAQIGVEAWIGLGDPDTEGRYVWVDGTVAWEDGTAVLYTNWRDGVPEDKDHEDCVQYDTEWSDGQWADDDCSFVFPFVCEAPAP